MTLYRLLFATIFCISLNSSYSQELPPIQNFGPKNYHAENQNWSIAQAESKFIYVANNKGLLEFNGNDWMVYPSPNSTIMRSVHAIGNRIYSGCYMEFGYWEKDELGILNYTSLSSNLNNLVEDEQFWKIESVNRWVLFQSLDRIYIYDTENKSFEIVDPPGKIHKMFLVDETVYFQELNGDLYYIRNGNPVALGIELEIRNFLIVNIFKNDNQLLLITEKNGIYIYQDSKLKKWSFSLEKYFQNLSIYSAIESNSGNIILGSISNGLISIDRNGNIQFQINESSGLNNNTVLSSFQDIDGNLWLGLDNGISFINLNSPFRIFHDSTGNLGTIYTSIVVNNKLYVGTNQGLFYKNYPGDKGFNFIPGTNGQVWNLQLIDNTLFCNHHKGTFIVEENKASRIQGNLGSWLLKSAPTNPNIIFVGSYGGLNVLERSYGEWKYRNKIENFDISSRYFEFVDSHTILVNHEYKGVIKLTLDSIYGKVTSIEVEKNINKSLNSSLVKFDDQILYSGERGVFRFNTTTNEFEKDSLISSFYADETYSSGKLIYDEQNNRLWGFNSRGLVYLNSDGLSENREINSISLLNDSFNNMIGYENISSVSDQKYLFGGSNAYLTFDLDKLKPNEIELSLNSVEIRSLEANFNNIDKSKDQPEFDNKFNNIRFQYSVPEYVSFGKVEFQNMLEGHYNHWSDWTTSSTQQYENLQAGDYIFKVRARLNGQISRPQNFSFTIKKPWYLSNILVSFYVLGFIILLIAIHLIYKTYYKNQRLRLLEKAQKELELKQLEGEQKLIALNNEKLKQDIENKNRELAISTMNLIKKNEFLNSVKTELSQVKEVKNIKPIIRLLDKNLNSSDDWELFKEAFNNADKDFLKKLKSNHPNLTPNDLKLCAYLRLNLTSKEIAPLLNISYRSTEVKRYRLRKKMNLPHETDLTNYILEL